MSLDVRAGEVFGLLGPNGAGKTTTIAMLATERAPTGGDAMLFGHSIAGLFDVANRVGVKESYADTGQTLGTYGVAPGAYLVVPFLPPLTVRDGIGYAVDSMLDPVSYFAPLAANFGRSAVKTINERAANPQLYGVSNVTLKHIDRV